jgi:hypothetical protein
MAETSPIATTTVRQAGRQAHGAGLRAIILAGCRPAPGKGASVHRTIHLSGSEKELTLFPARRWESTWPNATVFSK